MKFNILIIDDEKNIREGLAAALEMDGYNVVLAKDAIATYSGNVMRLLILSTHYRAPVSFTEDTVKSTVNELEKVRKTWNQLSVSIQLNHGNLKSPNVDVQSFIEAMADDLNTSNAIAALFEKVKLANIELRKNPTNLEQIEGIYASINAMLKVLGIVFDMPVLTAELEATYREYLKLKSEKRFEESDKLREVLLKNNII